MKECGKQHADRRSESVDAFAFMEDKAAAFSQVFRMAEGDEVVFPDVFRDECVGEGQEEEKNAERDFAASGCRYALSRDHWTPGDRPTAIRQSSLSCFTASQSSKRGDPR